MGLFSSVLVKNKEPQAQKTYHKVLTIASVSEKVHLSCRLIIDQLPIDSAMWPNVCRSRSTICIGNGPFSKLSMFS